MSTPRAETSSLTSSKVIDKYADILSLVQDVSDGGISREEVLRRGIPWDSIAPMMTEKELEAVKKYDKKVSERAALLEKNGDTYAKIFMTLLSKFNRVEYLQYVITLVDDMLLEDPERTELFWKLKDEPETPGVPKLPLGPLVFLVRMRAVDGYVNSKACSILCTFCMKFPSVDIQDKKDIFGWLAAQICKEPIREVLIGLTALGTLLRRNEFREAFWKEGGLDALRSVIRVEQTNVQVLYQGVYALWLLSYHKDIRKTMTDPILVSNLVDILKHVTKDKVIRMSIATLRNILDLGENNEMMIARGIMRILVALTNKKWGDEDIEGDLLVLQETLEKKVNDLSSFDVYKNELLSKKLDWSSPPHRSEKFWRQNVLRFEDDDYRCLRILKQIIEEEQNTRVVAVAAWDIGEFVRYHPRGKLIAKQLDVKISVMKLLTHESTEVKKEALLTLQKLMVSNWEYLNQ